ncbi:MAG TPA: DUF3343 domain-containing protein [Desulfosporosinus sp.]|nr:DUF3343 domain-containing protein [Desulfosporosinus sp.]
MGYLAVFSSINMVNRLKSRLNRGGEYFGMIRAPHGISLGGCGFALRFEESQLLQVKQAAQELGVVINGIYQEGNYDNGNRVYIRIG